MSRQRSSVYHEFLFLSSSALLYQEYYCSLRLQTVSYCKRLQPQQRRLLKMWSICFIVLSLKIDPWNVYSFSLRTDPLQIITRSCNKNNTPSVQFCASGNYLQHYIIVSSFQYNIQEQFTILAAHETWHFRLKVPDEGGIHTLVIKLHQVTTVNHLGY